MKPRKQTAFDPKSLEACESDYFKTSHSHRRGAGGAKVLKSGCSATGREVSRASIPANRGSRKRAEGAQQGEAQGVTKALCIH